MSSAVQEQPGRLFSKGIFSSPSRAWSAVAVYTLILYSTLTLAFDFYIWVFGQIGRDRMSWLLNLSYLVIGFVVLVLLVKRRLSSPRAFLVLALVALVTGWCLYREDVPANRIHFLQYGPLTILVLDALRFPCRSYLIYAWTLAVVTLIGVGDELLQGVLSDRRFDPHDVVLNSLAAVLTLSLVAWVMGAENYPWGRVVRRRKRAGG